MPVVPPNSRIQLIGVAVTPDGSHAYVANNGSDTVSLIDTVTNQLVQPIALPPGSTSPAGVVITPDGKYVYVTAMNNNNSNRLIAGTVSVISTATNAIVGDPITVGNSPLGISVTPDGKYVYVANTNLFNGNNGGTPASVSVISTATHLLFTSFLGG